MVVGDTYVFSPGFLTLVLTQLFFPRPLTTFLTCFGRGDRRKYASKITRLNWVSNSPLSHPGGVSFGQELTVQDNFSDMFNLK